jgi:hypothetical protein
MPSTARLTSDAPVWRGQSLRLPQGFRLTKPNGDHPISAACEVWSHPDGWELRMVIDGHGVLLATVEGSTSKMLTRVEKWRAAMLEKGWTG